MASLEVLASLPSEDKKEPKIKHKVGRPRKGEKREPIKPKILNQQKDMQTVDEMLSLVSQIVVLV